MKQQTSSYQLEIMEERRATESVYTLLCMTHGSLVKYAVCIEDRFGSDIAWIGDKEEGARIAFDHMVAGSLSSIHLMDIAADFYYERSLEIF